MEHAQTANNMNGLVAQSHVWDMLDWNSYSWNMLVDCNTMCKVLHKLDNYAYTV